jgi:hypothetical protein
MEGNRHSIWHTGSMIMTVNTVINKSLLVERSSFLMWNRKKSKSRSVKFTSCNNFHTNSRLLIMSTYYISVSHNTSRCKPKQNYRKILRICHTKIKSKLSKLLVVWLTEHVGRRTDDLYITLSVYAIFFINKHKGSRVYFHMNCSWSIKGNKVFMATEKLLMINKYKYST